MLVNLVSNVIKLFNGGRVFKLTCGWEASEALKFAIEDQGIGMLEEDLEVAFRTFSQFDNALKRDR